MSTTRHCGVIRNTGSRVFVVWRNLPDDYENCLVVYRDSLPEAYVHAVTDLVMTRGQSTIDLWEVMHSVGYLDGRKMLDVLHNMGHLKRVRTCDVDIHTGGNVKISLDVLNEAIDNNAKTHEDGKVKDYNPFDPKKQDTKVEEETIVAQLLKEAKHYEQLSKDTYERVYNLEPTLRPSGEVQDKDGFFSIEFQEGISQTKAIEKLKKVFAERKNG